MNERRSLRRVVRRIRYSDGENTVDVTTVVTPNRPTREPPSIPGTPMPAPPPPAVVPDNIPILNMPPPAVPDGMPLLQMAVSERFMATINRAAGLVDDDHPLVAVAESLVSLASRPMRGMRRVPIMRPRPNIIYDTVIVDSSKTIDDADKCPICLSEYEEGEECGVLPCKHNFHDFCIRTWVDANRSCPLCRLCLN
jgi:hypothetical protein